MKSKRIVVKSHARHDRTVDFTPADRQLDITGLSEDTVNRIAAKLGQAPTVVEAYWHRE